MFTKRNAYVCRSAMTFSEFREATTGLSLLRVYFISLRSRQIVDAEQRIESGSRSIIPFAFNVQSEEIMASISP